MPSPVVLLAFANDRRGCPGRYMRELVAEKREIVEALRPAERLGACRIAVESDASLRTLGDALDAAHDDIEVVHYGGHASESGIVLEDADGQPREALAAGLAVRLGGLPRLSLVVLNGCATADHVGHIHRYCRAAVIVTDRPVRDDIARHVARRLYHGLACGLTVREACTAAEGEAFAMAGGDADAAWPANARMLRPAAPAGDSSTTPWQLFTHPDAPEKAGWRLVRRRPEAPSDAGPPVGATALADVLARTHGTPPDARSLLLRAGVSPSHIPPMRGSPVAWWYDIVARVDAGLADRGALIRFAAAERPHNTTLARLAGGGHPA